MIYIVVDRVGAPYRVLLYQPGIRFIHLSNSKGLCLQHMVTIRTTCIYGIEYSFVSLCFTNSINPYLPLKSLPKCNLSSSLRL